MCLESSRKVRSGLAACCRCYESGCARDVNVARSDTLVQTSLALVPTELLGEPSVSRQQVSLAVAAARAVGVCTNSMLWKHRCSGQTGSIYDSEPDLSFLDRTRMEPSAPDRRGAIPAAFSSAGSYLRSLRLPATAVNSRKSLVQSRLALAERCLQRSRNGVSTQISQFSW